MRRREYLIGTGVIVTPTLAGCIRDDNEQNTGNDEIQNVASNEGEYPECHLIEVQYDWLPNEIQDEVDSSISEGEYSSDELLFEKAVNTEESYIVREDIIYKPKIEYDGNQSILTLEETDSIHDKDSRILNIINKTDNEVNISFELLKSDDVYASESINLEPNSDIEKELTDKFGTYSLKVEDIDTGNVAEHIYEINDGTNNAMIEITEEEIHVFHEEYGIVPCRWG